MLFKNRFLILTIMLSLGLLLVQCGEEEEPEPEFITTIALTPSSNEVMVNEVFETYLKVKNIEDLMTVGAKIYFDKYKLEVFELERIDDFLVSNGGTVIQLVFNVNNDEGYISIGLQVAASYSVSSGMNDEWQDICKVVFKAISPGSCTATVDIDHESDGDVGLFNSNADLIEDVTVENAAFTISN
ncbi:hypothetical protein JXI42_05655 [bacterium]|nr:hypothetical protein [bacterium]